MSKSIIEEAKAMFGIFYPIDVTEHLDKNQVPELKDVGKVVQVAVAPLVEHLWCSPFNGFFSGDVLDYRAEVMPEDEMECEKLDQVLLSLHTADDNGDYNAKAAMKAPNKSIFSLADYVEKVEDQADEFDNVMEFVLGPVMSAVAEDYRANSTYDPFFEPTWKDERSAEEAV